MSGNSYPALNRNGDTLKGLLLLGTNDQNLLGQYKAGGATYAPIIKVNSNDQIQIGDGAIDCLFAVNGLAFLASAMPFRRPMYESAQQTITAAGALTLAHGLGVAPRLIVPRLVCVNADIGYSAGDIADPPLMGSSANGNFGCAITSDAANVYVRFGAAAGSFFLINKGTGISAGITAANWRFVVRAFA